MGFTSEFVKDLSFNLAHLRQNYLVMKMRQLNEEIEKTQVEETKQALLAYKEELWDIAHRIGQLLDRMSLDEQVGPPVREQVRGILARMRTGE